MKTGGRQFGEIFVSKTVYDPSSKTDGFRVLVMRMWPRGVKKTQFDKWMKELGTQKDLIKSWKAREITFQKFKTRYVSDTRKSMDAGREIEELISHLMKGEDITLLCVERDPLQCHRSFLKSIIEERLKESS